MSALCTLFSTVSIPKNIPIIFHNGSHDYYFIIKELAEEFKKQFTCLKENFENT